MDPKIRDVSLYAYTLYIYIYMQSNTIFGSDYHVLPYYSSIAENKKFSSHWQTSAERESYVTLRYVTFRFFFLQVLAV